MQSLRELYRIGTGPSSSHTMGPQAAARQYLERHPEATAFDVTLYGSLAATGKGHMTDVAILRVLEAQASVDLHWKPTVFLPFHPNGMKFAVRKADGSLEDEWTVYSIGGGALSEGNDTEPSSQESAQIYPLTTMKEIMHWCQETGHAFWEYVEQCEGKEIWDFLREVWLVMQAAVERGIDHEGILPGPLGLQRKAPIYYTKAKGYKANLQSSGLVYAYALAVSEENADNGRIVTAPTCGACGVLPAVLYYLYTKKQFPEEKIIRALGVAGLFGELAKKNASVSGAECGCQAEVGVACSMAAAAAGWLFGYNLDQIEYSAEVALEHHLGLTCDPICGLVQIPCIERNAVAAMRALNSANLAYFLSSTRRISYDMVLKSMYQTHVLSVIVKI